MPIKTKKTCIHCHNEYGAAGIRLHELRCPMNPDKSKPMSTPANKPQEDIKPESKIITAKEPEIAPAVKIEAVKVKPKETTTTEKEHVPKTRKIKEIQVVSKPVTRKPVDLFDKPVEKQEAKPVTETKKTEKENRERGLFSFHRDD